MRFLSFLSSIKSSLWRGLTISCLISNFKQTSIRSKKPSPEKPFSFCQRCKAIWKESVFLGTGQLPSVKRYKVIKVHLVGNLLCGDVQSVAVDVKMSFRPENCFHMSHVWCKSLLMEFFSWKYCELEQCVLIGRAKYAFYRKNRTWYETCAVRVLRFNF